MDAIRLHRYGSTDDLTFEDLPVPGVGDGEVRVRVVAASVNAGDRHLMRGDPFLVRLAFGLRRPKVRVLGADVAGVVEAVGRNVTSLAVGDAVFGELTNHGWGAFAEQVVAPAEAFVRAPAGLDLAEAAALPVTAVTALQALRDHAGVRVGERVLVNGASGGVGTYAVQLAKALGAEVTGVASTRNLDLVKELGADHVIDYTQGDWTLEDHEFDVIIDAAAHRSLRDYNRVLAETGRYVLVGGASRPFWQALLFGALIGGRRTFKAMFAKPNREDLELVKQYVEAGAVRPVIGKRFPLRETPAAIAHVERGGRGKTLVEVAPGLGASPVEQVAAPVGVGE